VGQEMKKIDSFQHGQIWFLDKHNDIGPLTMAYRCGDSVVAPRHYHRTTYEYFLVLSGQATLEVNGYEIRLRPRSVVIVEPEEIHCLKDATDDFGVILIMDKYIPHDKVVLDSMIGEE
jgi:mannose-6-phosphate isomerase-like protein (cupin superfamily)